MSDFDVTLGYRITKTLYEAVYSYDNAENDT